MSNIPKSNILVFPCGSETGLEINQSLKWDKRVNLFGASSVISNHGKYVFENYIEGLPFINNSKFFHEFNKIIDKHQINFVYPAYDDVVLKLAENADRIHCKIIGSPKKTCRMCRSKKLVYEYLSKKIKTPTVFLKSNEIDHFPVFLKPEKGQGSKGIFVAYSKKDVDFYLAKDASLLILEYLPGKEYTVDCFTDRYGKLRFAGARERMRIMNGISVNTKPIIDQQFQEMAKQINSALTFRGAWFFQVKESKNGNLVLMEVAPRIAGTMGLYRNLGINFPLLSFYDSCDIDVDILPNNFDIEMDRALGNKFKTNLRYDHVYVDLEDCLIIKNQINTTLMQFLYQCVNKKNKLVLLTRYMGDIKSLLQKYRLNALFDEIIFISKKEAKSQYIHSQTAIFIDDSFSERAEVQKTLGIPVFDLSAIENLIQ